MTSREFGLKVRVARELEDFGPVGFEVVFGPEPLDGGLRDAPVGGHGAHAPAGQARRGLGHFGQDAAFDLLRDGGFAPAAGPILQGAEPFQNEAGAGFAHGVEVQAHLAGYLAVGHALGGQQDRLGPERFVPLAGTGLGQGVQASAFLLIQFNDGSFGHRPPR
jgi:hypothetical protein